MKKIPSRPFFQKGVQFECTRCGKCCTGYPGYVYLSEHDILGIAHYLGIGTKEFVKRYTRLVFMFHEQRLSLVEKNQYDCVFWDALCTIYPARPHQCRTYPFWKRHLVSRREWEKTAAFCPGINRGRVYSQKEIEELMYSTPTYNVQRFSPHLKREIL
jgi:Fe-S-cluster containining protein